MVAGLTRGVYNPGYLLTISGSSARGSAPLATVYKAKSKVLRMLHEEIARLKGP